MTTITERGSVPQMRHQSWWQQAATGPASLVRSLRRNMRIDAEIRALAMMDDTMLSDIDLTRQDLVLRIRR